MPGLSPTACDFLSELKLARGRYLCTLGARPEDATREADALASAIEGAMQDGDITHLDDEPCLCEKAADSIGMKVTPAHRQEALL